MFGPASQLFRLKRLDFVSTFTHCVTLMYNATKMHFALGKGY